MQTKRKTVRASLEYIPITDLERASKALWEMIRVAELIPELRIDKQPLYARLEQVEVELITHGMMRGSRLKDLAHRFVGRGGARV